MEEDFSTPAPPTVFQAYRAALIFGGVSFFFIVLSILILFKTTQTTEPIRFSSDTFPASKSAVLLVVDIEGEVTNPGVYTMPEGSRVEDVLAKAGGLTAEADALWVGKTLNRASLLTDGAKFYIPSKGSGAIPFPSGSIPVLGQAVVSINTATDKELDALPGIGAVTVGKIVINRPYQRLEELLEKKVLTPSVYEKVKARLGL
jgi:competence protein ComEA